MRSGDRSRGWGGLAIPGDFDSDFGPFFGGGTDRKRGAEKGGSFPHIDQAQTRTAKIVRGIRGRKKPFAVVPDFENEGLVPPGEFEPDRVCLGVLLDVVESFLKNPVNREL